MNDRTENRSRETGQTEKGTRPARRERDGRTDRERNAPNATRVARADKPSLFLFVFVSPVRSRVPGRGDTRRRDDSLDDEPRAPRADAPAAVVVRCASVRLLGEERVSGRCVARRDGDADAAADIAADARQPAVEPLAERRAVEPVKRERVPRSRWRSA